MCFLFKKYIPLLFFLIFRHILATKNLYKCVFIISTLFVELFEGVVYTKHRWPSSTKYGV